MITVVIPEFVTQWKTQWLHNQSAFALKARLLYRPEHRRHVGAGARRRRGVGRHVTRTRPEWRRCSSGSRTRSPSRTSGQLDLRIGDKVRAIVDLPGVAEGTEGKVILANGFNWQRYRVRFPDGTELGDLDHRHLEPIGRAAKRLAKAAARAS